MFRVCFDISEDKRIELTTNKTTNKTAEKILKKIIQNPEITSKELSDVCGISPDGIRYHIRNMKQSKLLIRIGGKKKGHWQVNGKS